jgi:uncharacterized membrane protein
MAHVIIKLFLFQPNITPIMSLTTLKDDLLREFREERIMINDQIELLDPLATSLRKPAAQRMLSSGTLIMAEIICYIISIGGIAVMALMHLIYPFSVLKEVFYNSEMRNKTGALNLLYLNLAIYGLVALCVIFVFIIGRMAREMRLKNDILNHAGKDIKTIVGQHLERKAALDTIEQRHLLGLSGIGQPARQPMPVGEVLNPAY